MGCSIKAAYDHYDSYTAICEALKIEPIGMSEAFYKHEQQIFKEWNVSNQYEFWEEWNFKTLMYARYY
jgi:hypothetical protein